jgi:hypothetical protein
MLPQSPERLRASRFDSIEILMIAAGVLVVIAVAIAF